MSEQQPPQAARLRRMTVRVPDDYAGDLRRFARELRSRQQGGPAPAPEWRRVSPSAELMFDPECRARCVIRDTRAPGAGRFLWTVAVLGQLDPVAEGRAKDRAEARLLAKAAVAAYFAAPTGPSDGGSACDD